MAYLIAIVAILAMGFGGGWEAKGMWDAREIAAIKEAVQQEKDEALAIAKADRERAEQMAAIVETKLSKLRITNTTINQEVQRETTHTVYGSPNCDVPASGVLLINQSVSEANRAAGYVPAEMPAAAGAAGKGKPSDDGRSLQPR